VTEEEVSVLCDLVAFDYKVDLMLPSLGGDTYWWLFESEESLDDANTLAAGRTSFPDGLSISRT
jgi:hypothetical protein